jgi:hypothetical protein
MQPTKELLKKIDFTQCKVGLLDGWQLSVSYNDDNDNILRINQTDNSHRMYKNHDTEDKPWRTSSRSLTLNQVAQLKTACDTVDAFIVSELARIEKEEKLPTVKLPEGHTWERHVGIVALRDDDGTLWLVPAEKKARDKYCALAEAYDKENNVETVTLNGAFSRAKTDNGIELLCDNHGMVCRINRGAPSGEFTFTCGGTRDELRKVSEMVANGAKVEVTVRAKK